MSNNRKLKKKKSLKNRMRVPMLNMRTVKMKIKRSFRKLGKSKKIKDQAFKNLLRMNQHKRIISSKTKIMIKKYLKYH